MRELLEIIVAFLAVFGAWSLIRGLRESILFPKKIRMSVSAAIHDGVEKDGRAPLRKFCEREMESEPVLMDGTDLMRLLFEQI